MLEDDAGFCVAYRALDELERGRQFIPSIRVRIRIQTNGVFFQQTAKMMNQVKRVARSFRRPRNTVGLDRALPPVVQEF